MRHSYYRIWFILVVAANFAFAHSIQKKLDPKVLEKLRPGETTKEEITKLLGKPAEVTDFSKNPNTRDRKDLGELWEYEEKDSTILSVSFRRDSTVLDTWTWNVPNAAPEQDLATAMSKYTLAHWEPDTVRWINPHAFPTECFFRDNAKGISIAYNRVRKEVSSISRWDPSRGIASIQEEKHPEFCIGNTCTPAYSQEEFFKEVPLSKYCAVPKQ